MCRLGPGQSRKRKCPGQCPFGSATPMSSPGKVSKEEREAAKASEKAAKEAVKARKDAIKDVKATYKAWAGLLKSKETAEVKAGLEHANDADFMTLGGGLSTLLRVLKSKVCSGWWLRR